MSEPSFAPDPEQMALWPNVSGNDINGLGDQNLRQPNYVYWGNDPNDIAFGALQRWFYSFEPGIPEFDAERKNRAEILTAPLQEIAGQRETIKQTVALSFFGKGVKEGIFDKAGVAEFDPI